MLFEQSDNWYYPDLWENSKPNELLWKHSWTKSTQIRNSSLEFKIINLIHKTYDKVETFFFVASGIFVWFFFAVLKNVKINYNKTFEVFHKQKNNLLTIFSISSNYYSAAATFRKKPFQKYSIQKISKKVSFFFTSQTLQRMDKYFAKLFC